jgi:hypothetical protein
MSETMPMFDVMIARQLLQNKINLLAVIREYKSDKKIRIYWSGLLDTYLFSFLKQVTKN